VNVPRQAGATLAVGVIVLALVTLLGLAGASAAHVERLLAQNEAFRENAAMAASAGIEHAISAIVNSSDPGSVPALLAGSLAGGDRFEVSVRFAGLETTLPQAPGARAAGAHFEITSTGYGARRAVDRQRADVLWVVEGTVTGTDCEPLLPRPCHLRGDLERLSWQRVAVQ
jgi:Tfp pilus assembly protein PilX